MVGPVQSTAPAVGAGWVATVEAAEQLADRLLDPDRPLPVVVLSLPAGAASPWIDPEEIVAEVGDLAEVVCLPTGALSWAFAARLPTRTEVYGGAGRVYPVGLAWTTDPYRSPLRFAYSAAEGRRAAADLISDALGMATVAGLLTPPAAGEREVEATVIGLPTPTRALVDTPAGHAAVWQEATFADIALDRVLTRGMGVRGVLDPAHGRLDLRPFMPPGAQLVASYRVGDNVLAQVAEVRTDTAVVRLHPDVAVVVSREEVSSDPEHPLTQFLTAGEVLIVRVVDAKGPLLSLLGTTEDGPVPAVALLPGGPPWLTPQDVGCAAPSPVVVLDPPSTPADRDLWVPGSRPDGGVDELARLARLVADLRIERDAVAGRLAGLMADLAAADADRLAQRTRFRQAEQSRQRLAGELRVARDRAQQVSGTGAFADPEEQFRHEVHLAWVARIPATAKADQPLTDYTIGADFLSSLTHTHGVDRGKVVDVVVEVVLGLDSMLAGRDRHQLRQSAGGGAAPVVRADGATCWRVALQRGSAAARRLHYWRTAGGGIELSRVTVHDDMTP